MTSLSVMSSANIRDLHSVFTETPHTVRENLKYISYDPRQKQFSCLSCRMPITKSNLKVEVMTNDFNRHFNCTRHTQQTVATSFIRDKLISLFQNKVPQVVKDNVSVISFRGNNYICTACNEMIPVSMNSYETTNKLSTHLILQSHKANMTRYEEILTHLRDIYGGTPSIVMINSDHLTKVSSAEYKCTACDHSLKIQQKNRKEREKIFNDHLTSEMHKRNAQQAKSYALVPELDYIYDVLPNYILRNIAYMSTNGSDFFCSLCATNISLSDDVFETKHSLRVHFLLTDHEKKLTARMDLNNRAFSMLRTFFDGIPYPILVDHLKYLSFVENSFGCNLCSEVLIDSKESDVRIRDALTSHCESNDHKSNVQCNIDQQTEVLKDLDELYGAVPQFIKENIQHIVFKNGIDFTCTLCNKPLKAKKNCNYVVNTSTTKRNFEAHLNSDMHMNGLDNLYCLELAMRKNLGSLFPRLPQVILTSLQHLGFREGTIDYHCYLCDEPITYVTGKNGTDLTKRNLIFHVNSENHTQQLKNQANIEQDSLSALESVFYKVPTMIISGAENLELRNGSYYCNLCKVTMKRSEGYLWSHFHGRNHTSLLEDLENECTEAFYQLDRRFRRIPESVLRNIDYLLPLGYNLLCAPCQDILPLNKRDLEGTKNLLKSHMCSSKHKTNLSQK